MYLHLLQILYANTLAVHSIIFGDMGPASSPNEPLFFLHHGNVDRAWAKVRLAIPLFVLLHHMQFLTLSIVARPQRHPPG